MGVFSQIWHITLECKSATSYTVDYAPDNGPVVDCSAHLPPPNTSNGNPGVLFEELPGTGGGSIGYVQARSINFEMNTNTYWAIKTTFPNELISRKESFTEPFGNTNRAGYTVSISSCPGDFASNSPDTNGRCVVSGGNISIIWSTDSSSNPIFECILNPGNTYYLNVIHSLVPPYSLSDCKEQDCGVLFQETLN